MTDKVPVCECKHMYSEQAASEIMKDKDIL